MHFRPEAIATKIVGWLLMALLLTGCATSDHHRSTGTMVDDQAIEIRAMDSLHRNGPGRGNHIKATSFNRVVLLTGEVKTEAMREEAVAMVAAIPNVRRVVNELAIGEPTGLGRRSRDTLLTGQVKGSLLGAGIEGFDPVRIKVVSVRGIVYLMGLVTPEEADIVAERVAGLQGVRQVVKVFDYTQPAADGG